MNFEINFDDENVKMIMSGVKVYVRIMCDSNPIYYDDFIDKYYKVMENPNIKVNFHLSSTSFFQYNFGRVFFVDNNDNIPINLRTSFYSSITNNFLNELKNIFKPGYITPKDLVFENSTLFWFIDFDSNLDVLKDLIFEDRNIKFENITFLKYGNEEVINSGIITSYINMNMYEKIKDNVHSVISYIESYKYGGVDNLELIEDDEEEEEI
jgi:hypothetical protein